MTGRSRGSSLLSRCGKTATEIARDVGVSGVSVHRWISGEKRPSAERRARIEVLFGVDAKAWDENTRPTSPVAAPAVPCEVSSPKRLEPKRPRSLAEELERSAWAMLRTLDDDRIPLITRARILALVAKTVFRLSRHARRGTGDTHPTATDRRSGRAGTNRHGGR